MASALQSAEVVADFRDALQDLQINNRYEINNLTIIAKENTEHAMALSRELENHIRQTAPQRKLPALYVLDSIVKNVGSPYTIYLARDLYRTFIDAYTLVDAATRRSMENMLKTWKEPVPGSMDSRPVFPVDSTRPIENALIKARTAFHQQQQMQTHSQLPQQQQQPQQYGMLPARPVSAAFGTQWGQTPPPSHSPFAAPAHQGEFLQGPGGGGQVNGYQNNQVRSMLRCPPYALLTLVEIQQQQAPAPATLTPQPAPQPNFYQSPDFSFSDVQGLTYEVKRLIPRVQVEWAANPYDPDIGTKFKALLDLEKILSASQLSHNELQLVRHQVARYSALYGQSAQPAESRFNEGVPGLSAYPPQRPTSGQAAGSYTPSISSTDLAAMLAQVAPPSRPTPPGAQSAIPPTYNTHGRSASSTDMSGNSDLIASLRASGLLPTSTPDSAQTHSRQTSRLEAPLMTPSVSLNNGRNIATRSVTLLPPNDAQLKGPSLRIPRQYLTSILYSKQSTQCTTCGRRFTTNEDGKAAKARHLDFHFRTNQRLTDSARRGVNRSWFIDAVDWIKYRETGDDGEQHLTAKPEEDNNSLLPGNNAHQQSDRANMKRPYIKAPADAATGDYSCPICQEPFETTWHDEAQEWVWMDAVRVGNRVFHASCHAEVSKSRATPVGSPMLGKRKAEDDIGSSRSLKKELIS